MGLSFHKLKLLYEAIYVYIYIYIHTYIYPFQAYTVEIPKKHAEQLDTWKIEHFHPGGTQYSASSRGISKGGTVYDPVTERGYNMDILGIYIYIWILLRYKSLIYLFLDRAIHLSNMVRHNSGRNLWQLITTLGKPQLKVSSGYIHSALDMSTPVINHVQPIW